MIDNYPPLQSILSAIKIPSYDIAKHLVPLLEPITTNKFTIKNIFEFAKEIIKKDYGLFKVSLDGVPFHEHTPGGDYKYFLQYSFC